MTHESLLAFALFALATSITPGPNNIMLITSGVNFGFRASLPHMLGVTVGFALLLISTGLGLNELFTRYPGVYVVMKWVGVWYFIYFAWKMASAPIKPMRVDGSTSSNRAWRFRDAVAFQWVNPKGWIMAAGAFSSYVPTMSKTGVIVAAALLFALIAVPCFILWVSFGAHLRRYLEQGQRRRYFNIGMAILLLASLLPLFVID
jgi:threonine/homoserine/homoserine lactone efflux protein